MELLLNGVRPEPLGSYLTALGVLRVVAEQVDADAQGWWSSQGFFLDTSLGATDVVDFFVDDYVPTPLVSPWNKGSGLRRDGKSRSAERGIAALEASTDPRFAPYRRAIASARQISDAYPDANDFVAAKDEIIRRARSTFPDEALPWIDAAVVMTDDGPAYPHVLGTGGNLGRLDLTANTAHHLDSIIGFETPADRSTSGRWLADTLFADQTHGRVKMGSGQYEPSTAGGVNTSTIDGGVALVNPWGFVLTMEGAVLLASGAARRLGTHQSSVAAMPFTVRPTTVGAAHLSEAEEAKGELWLPLWGRPARLAELRRLFGEGRLEWRGRHATTGLDAVRAVTSLGAERGITAFTRSVVANRLGQSPLAVPAGRVSVTRRAATMLTADLDAWIRTVRRQRLPGSLAESLHEYEAAVYEAAGGHGSNARAVQKVLTAAAVVDAHIGRNGQLRKAIPPAPPLTAEPWLAGADDGTPEFALAAALASCHDASADDGPRADAESSWRPCLRDYLRPVRRDGTRLAWHQGTRTNLGDVHHGLPGVLAHLHQLHATAPRSSGSEATAKAHTSFDHGLRLPTNVVEAFVAGWLDDRRISAVLSGLLLLRPSGKWKTGDVDRGDLPPKPVPAWRILAPLHHREALRMPGLEEAVILLPRASWPRGLRSNAVEVVLRQAMTSYRSRGLRPVVSDPGQPARGVDGVRLSAGLLLHLRTTEVRRLVSATCDVHMPERGAPTHSEMGSDARQLKEGPR